MADKDILERVKGWIKESKRGGFPMLRADVAFIFFDELIQEVEKLRELVYPYMGEWQNKIDSLTKERDIQAEGLRRVSEYNERLEAENAELKEELVVPVQPLLNQITDLKQKLAEAEKKASIYQSIVEGTGATLEDLE